MDKEGKGGWETLTLRQKIGGVLNALLAPKPVPADFKEDLTFSDKLGRALMSLGLIVLLVGALVHFSWIITYLRFGNPDFNVVHLLVILAVAGIALVRLSFYTVKKIKK